MLIRKKLINTNSLIDYLKYLKMKIFIVGVLVFLGVINTYGQTWSQIDKVIASDGNVEELFGYSVAISGDWAMVGAPYEDLQDEGAVYVFQLVGGTWVETQKLKPSSSYSDGFFGLSIDMAGGVAVIGAIGDNGGGDNTGAAFVFELEEGTWVEKTKLIPSDPFPSDEFGGAVAVSGNSIVVGAHGKFGVGYYSGAAYVFKKIDGLWSETQKLTASDQATWDYFGNAVDIEGDRIVVAAYLNDIGASGSGSVYVFEFVGGTWTEEQIITASDPAEDDNFGNAVVLNNDRILVSARGDDNEYGADAGAVYYFDEIDGDFVEQQKIIVSDAQTLTAFGTAISVSGNTAVIGSMGHTDYVSYIGAVNVYEYVDGLWEEGEKLTAGTDTSAYDIFGNAVGLDNNRLVVGARGGDDNGDLSGAAYFFHHTYASVATINTTFLVYPNPFNNEFTINTNGEYTYTLCNIYGQVLLQGKANGKEILRNNDLSKGVYFLTVNTNDVDHVIKLMKN